MAKLVWTKNLVRDVRSFKYTCGRPVDIARQFKATSISEVNLRGNNRSNKKKKLKRRQVVGVKINQ